MRLSRMLQSNSGLQGFASPIIYEPHTYWRELSRDQKRICTGAARLHPCKRGRRAERCGMTGMLFHWESGRVSSRDRNALGTQPDAEPPKSGSWTRNAPTTGETEILRLCQHLGVTRQAFWADRISERGSQAERDTIAVAGAETPWLRRGGAACPPTPTRDHVLGTAQPPPRELSSAEPGCGPARGARPEAAAPSRPWTELLGALTQISGKARSSGLHAGHGPAETGLLPMGT